MHQVCNVFPHICVETFSFFFCGWAKTENPNREVMLCEASLP